MDEEIIKRVQEGDKEAFGEIVDKYEKKLFWYIKRLINQPEEEVEDVLQEVFVSAYINILGFETTKKFSSWIYRIAHNKAVDYIKSAKNRHHGGKIDEEWEENIEDKKKLIEDLEIEKDERRRVRKAVGGLELKYREVVELYYFDEKSYEEISDILRIPVNNVGILLYRAKKKLKKDLSNE